MATNDDTAAKGVGTGEPDSKRSALTGQGIPSRGEVTLVALQLGSQQARLDGVSADIVITVDVSESECIRALHEYDYLFNGTKFWYDSRHRQLVLVCASSAVHGDCVASIVSQLSNICHASASAETSASDRLNVRSGGTISNSVDAPDGVILAKIPGKTGLPLAIVEVEYANRSILDSRRQVASLFHKFASLRAVVVIRIHNDYNLTSKIDMQACAIAYTRVGVNPQCTGAWTLGTVPYPDAKKASWNQAEYGSETVPLRVAPEKWNDDFAAGVDERLQHVVPSSPCILRLPPGTLHVIDEEGLDQEYVINAHYNDCQLNLTAIVKTGFDEFVVDADARGLAYRLIDEYFGLESAQLEDCAARLGRGGQHPTTALRMALQTVVQTNTDVAERMAGLQVPAVFVGCEYVDEEQARGYLQEIFGQ
jgi:hypothetical protein